MARTKDSPTPIPKSVEPALEIATSLASNTVAGWGKLVTQLGVIGAVVSFALYLMYDQNASAKIDREATRQMILQLEEKRGKQTDRVETIHEKSLIRQERMHERLAESVDKATEEMREAIKVLKARQ